MKELMMMKRKKKTTSSRRRRHHLCGASEVVRGKEKFEKAREDVLGKEEDKEKRYKAKRRAHKEAMERKYPGREYFSSVDAAVKAHLNDEEKELWKSEADSSSFFLRSPEKIRSQRYMFLDGDEIPIFVSSRIAASSSSSSTARLTTSGVNIEKKTKTKTKRGPKRRLARIVGAAVHVIRGETILTSSIVIDYPTTRRNRGKFRRVVVSVESFVSPDLKSLPQGLRKWVPKEQRLRAELSLRARLSVTSDARFQRTTREGEERTWCVSDEDGNLDLFFAKAAEHQNEKDVAVVAFDRGLNDTVRREGDECAALIPWKVLNLKTGVASWFTSGQLQRLLVDDLSWESLSEEAKWMRKEKSRFVLDIGAGSCLSSVHAHERATSQKKIYICVDPLILYTAEEKAWRLKNVVFVCAKIETFMPCFLPPVGIISKIFAAPECTAFSVQRNPFYADLNKKWGKQIGAALKRELVDRALVPVRSIIDLVVYFVCPFWLENPSGNDFASLFNWTKPFYDFECFLLETSYCKFGYEVRKNTCILTNVAGVELPKICKSGSYCVYLSRLQKAKAKEMKHKDECSFTGCARDENKIHPKDLIYALEEQI